MRYHRRHVLSGHRRRHVGRRQGEIAYAKKYGHKVVLGAETYSKEGDAVSYMEEGKTVMVSELTKLNAKLLSSLPQPELRPGGSSD